MAASRGRSSQFGIGEEVTYGTAVAPTRFLPYLTEGLENKAERTESESLRADAGYIDADGTWVEGKSDVSGPISLEVPTKGLGVLLLHALGAVTTTNSGSVYTHEFTLGSLAGKGLTLEVGWSDGVTPYAKKAAGCKVGSWEISAEVGKPVSASFGFVGSGWSVAAAKAVPSYASGSVALSWASASLTLGASSRRFESVKFAGDNALDADDFALGSLNRAEPVDAKRQVTGEASGNFTDWTDYQRFLDGTMATLEMTATGPEIVPGSPYSLIVSANVRTDGDAPQIGGPGRIAQPLKFKVLQGASLGLKIKYITTDTTP